MRQKFHRGQWLDVALIREKQPFAETAFKGGFKPGNSLRIEPAVIGGYAGEPLELGAVAGGRDNERASHRRAGVMLLPER